MTLQINVKVGKLSKNIQYRDRPSFDMPIFQKNFFLMIFSGS